MGQLKPLYVTNLEPTKLHNNWNNASKKSYEAIGKVLFMLKQRAIEPRLGFITSSQKKNIKENNETLIFYLLHRSMQRGGNLTDPKVSLY